MSAEELHGRIYDSAHLLAIAFAAAGLARGTRAGTPGPQLTPAPGLGEPWHTAQSQPVLEATYKVPFAATGEA
jgi:hypothetical protein